MNNIKKPQNGFKVSQKPSSIRKAFVSYLKDLLNHETQTKAELMMQKSYESILISPHRDLVCLYKYTYKGC